MEALIEQQKTAILQLHVYMKRFGKANKKTKKSVVYLTNRLSELSDWWLDFNDRNKQLIPLTDSAQPYFSEKTFDSTTATYLAHRENVHEVYKAVTGAASSSAALSDDSDEGAEEEDELGSNDNVSAVDKNVSAELPIQIPTEEANPGFVALKNQFNELYEVFEMIDNTTEASTTGYVTAQLDILKNAWGDFRSKYNKERDSGNKQLSNINFKAIQSKYATYFGALNDFKAKRPARRDLVWPK